MADLKDIQDVCLVDRILDKRINEDTGENEYLLRWQGVDADGRQYEDTWEPESNVLGEELIEEFEHARAQGFAQAGPSTRDRYAHHHHHGFPPYPHAPPHYPLGPSFLPPGSYPGQPPLMLHGGSGPYNMYGYAMAYPAGPYPMAMAPRPSSIFPSLSLQQKADKNLKTGTKRKKDGLMDDAKMGNPAKKPSHVYTSSGSSNGGSSNVIRVMNLDLDHERAFFRATVQKSSLIADPKLKLELAQYLTTRRLPPSPPLSTSDAAVPDSFTTSGPAPTTNTITTVVPSVSSSTNTGLSTTTANSSTPALSSSADDRVLAASETWLIEIKEQADKDGSLYLGLDIPQSIVKAIFIPEWMMAHQRRKVYQQQQQKSQVQEQQPAKAEEKESQENECGLVFKDRVTVSALMAGDLQSSGIFVSGISTPAPANATVAPPSAAKTLTAPQPQPQPPTSKPSRPGPEDAISQATTTSVTSGSAAQAASPVASKDNGRDGSRDQEMTEGSESAVSSLATTTTAEQPAEQQEQEQRNDVSAPMPTTAATKVHCGWQGCNRVMWTMDDLAQHVQKEHLQGTTVVHSNAPNQALTPSPSLPSTTTAVAWPILIPDLPKLATLTSDMTESTWQERCEVIQEAYDSLYSQVIQLQLMFQHHDTRLREAKVLYENTTQAARENSKWLEARLEWEVEKWTKYEEQKLWMTHQYPELQTAIAQVAAAKANEVEAAKQKERKEMVEKATADSQAVDKDENEDAVAEKANTTSTLTKLGEKDVAAFTSQEQSACTPTTASKPLPELPPLPAEKRMDMPMAKQSINNIREIQRMLAQASTDQASLERENQVLFEQKRQLDDELHKIQDHYRQTLIQLQQLEAKDRAKSGEIAERLARVETMKQQMAEQKQQARSRIDELLRRIEGLMVGNQNNGQHQQAQPLELQQELQQPEQTNQQPEQADQQQPPLSPRQDVQQSPPSEQHPEQQQEQEHQQTHDEQNKGEQDVVLNGSDKEDTSACTNATKDTEPESLPVAVAGVVGDKAVPSESSEARGDDMPIDGPVQPEQSQTQLQQGLELQQQQLTQQPSPGVGMEETEDVIMQDDDDEMVAAEGSDDMQVDDVDVPVSVENVPATAREETLGTASTGVLSALAAEETPGEMTAAATASPPAEAMAPVTTTTPTSTTSIVAVAEPTSLTLPLPPTELPLASPLSESTSASAPSAPPPPSSQNEGESTSTTTDDSFISLLTKMTE